MKIVYDEYDVLKAFFLKQIVYLLRLWIHSAVFEHEIWIRAKNSKQHKIFKKVCPQYHSSNSTYFFLYIHEFVLLINVYNKKDREVLM